MSGDTVLTSDVKRVLREERPEVAVVHAGGARLDVGKPILMTVDEVLEFARLAPGTIVATHLEALNHCPTTRAQLRARLAQAGLLKPRADTERWGEGGMRAGMQPDSHTGQIHFGFLYSNFSGT